MKQTLLATGCGVLLAAAPAQAEPTHANCLRQGNHLCGGASLNGQHIIVAPGKRPYRVRVYWPYPSNFVGPLHVGCARPRGATVVRAKVGGTDYAWIRTCGHTYRMGIS